MIRDDLKAVIDEFIDLIENGSPSIKQNESCLNRYLDELAIGLQVKSTTFADKRLANKLTKAVVAYPA